MLSPKPHFTWSPKRGAAKGGQTDPGLAGLSLHVKSSGQPFGSTRSSGMGAAPGHSEFGSAKLEYTFFIMVQKRDRKAQDNHGLPGSPKQETPYLACRTLGIILLLILSVT